ncbi:serine/threonine-protein kinase BRSK1-like isoform X3 [Clavelina lepadiformis]|uniref:serine/threonine-protein kinase BRSK1-like isoform X3 n=1 Tax=Clavelina lepadiformis TaxID=159417 RepID=UPI0040437434
MSLAAPPHYVGPYRLDKTLGKGQTGLVKMGIHCSSGRKVAVKVVNRETLSKTVINKVEREIAIMKLIEHPHVLGLVEVYENDKYLYLILELLAGGELFDYLVKNTRLSPREARHFFRQIVSAVDFCHAHSVCHRDLKPENLLLDENTNIKVADFGMASLQPEGFLLETSCGSPHYACPEVIRGEKYDGRLADVWSCGVILFALLVGTLPFDNDNLRLLLEQVKRGRYEIPPYVPSDVQDLLRRMIEVRPEKRYTLKDVLNHKWMLAGGTNGVVNSDVGRFGVHAIECPPLGAEENADPDVLISMTSLGCFRDHKKLIQELQSEHRNTEKVVYYLLLRRKKRHPSFHDDADSLPYKHPDAPRKRVDSSSSRSSLSSSSGDLSDEEMNPSARSLGIGGGRGNHRKLSAETLSERSSSASRRQTSSVHQSTPSRNRELPLIITTPQDNRSRSLTGESESRMMSSGSSSSGNNRTGNLPTNYYYNTQSRNGTQVPGSAPSKDPPVAPASPAQGNRWRQRLTVLKNSFLGSPRFHRRKMQAPSSEDVSSSSNMSPSMELTKRSWFGQFVSGSSSNVVSGRDRDDTSLTLMMNNRTLNSVVTELVHTFLKISNLTHTIVSSTRFRCEYKQQYNAGHPGFHNKLVSFQADITKTSATTGGSREKQQSWRKSSHGSYHVTFQLLSGPHRRFKRVMELIQTQLSAHTFVPQSKPEAGDISAYSRELQQLCTSAANMHNDVFTYKSKGK